MGVLRPLMLAAFIGGASSTAASRSQEVGRGAGLVAAGGAGERERGADRALPRVGGE
jgi:hypothetical protein